jgi:hypothetical protein
MCLAPVNSLFLPKFILGQHLAKGNSGLMLISIMLQWVGINYCDVESLR